MIQRESETEREMVAVATGGCVDRQDVCKACEGPMLYRVDPEGTVTWSFCGQFRCKEWLISIPEPAR